MCVVSHGIRLTPAGRRILDVAAELFYARGIHAVGVEAVAEAAGVTKKTLYDRFGSKDALVAAYLAERDERWRAWLLAYRDRTDDPVDRLLGTFDALRDWLRRLGPRGCGFVNAAAELVEADHPGRRVARRQKSWMRRYLADLAADAGHTSPELANQLFILHEGAAVAYSVAGVRDAASTARAAAAALLGVRVGE